MENPPISCEVFPTKSEKSWIYDEYYIGEKDENKRKSGKGENHWSGAKSLEWYHGRLLSDTMHGPGEYRWRWLGQEGTHFTYEGHFYCNRMHGYGTMSYPDGKVFTGLFHSNIRWGPGVESQACRKQDVGLWRGTQLVRLTWRPEAPSIAPDLCANPVGRALVEPYRVVLTSRCRNIGKTNSAIELLKQYGSDPLSATEKWNKLYPNNCTDIASLLCHTEAFERNYYKGKVKLLEEVIRWPDVEEDNSEDTDEIDPGSNFYYAWNNNKATLHMMKHSFVHDKQRSKRDIDLTDLLSGPRQHFKPAGNHELNCRALLMASFLGNIQSVVQLINEQGIHPDVADSQGNTAVMYATCGDQPEIIQFLVEAGANVDSQNDACCTPLAVALLRLACAQKDIPLSGMLQALLPPPTIPASPKILPEERKVNEWCIERSISFTQNAIAKSPSKLSKVVSERKIKAEEISAKDLAGGKKKTPSTSIKSPEIRENRSDESIHDDERVYRNVHNEYLIRLTDLFTSPVKTNNTIPYLFDVFDMVKYVDIPDEEPKKVPEKGAKGVPAKVTKDTIKPSKEILSAPDKDDSSMNTVEKEKEEMLARITLTTLQLLVNGANPKLAKCPQPVLFTAIVSERLNIIKHLVNFGCNINEVYPTAFGYTPLDVAVSLALTNENEEVVRVVLECGGLTNHRLRYGDTFSGSALQDMGPTLLHAVLAKKPENERQEEVQINLLELLLNYNCNPMIQFKGRSAVDIALTKYINLLHVFIENEITDLNSVINESNQTLLVKLFSIPFFRTVGAAERLQILTNLLLFGADPLLACQNGEEQFPNIFEFTKKTLGDLESGTNPASSPSKADPKKGKEDPKKVKVDPKKSKSQVSSKSIGKLGGDDVGDYKQAMDLVVECARLLHVRWLQAKLMKELVEIINKYKHRQWNMVMLEHKQKKAVRLWLTTQRCLEIWDLLKGTNKKIYSDNRILKYLLYIVTFYNSKPKILPSTKLKSEEKYSIELSVGRLLKERKIGSKMTQDLVSWKRPYVKPELTPKAEENKFNICFDCALPFGEEKIKCKSCKLVSFCSIKCMKANVDRVNCHPCSDYLKRKYFPTPSGSDIVVEYL